MNPVPSRADFCRLAKDYNIIPVYIELAVDMETPVSLYYKIVGDQPGFMLESADTSKTFGRYSFIGTEPFMTMVPYSDRLEVASGGDRQIIQGAPLEAMQTVLKRFSFPDMPNLPPFSGGAVGYLAYEAVATWERVRGMAIDAGTALGEFMLCKLVIAMDHLTHSARLICLAAVDDASAASDEYDKALTKITALVEKVTQSVKMPENGKQVPAADNQPPEDLALKGRYINNVLKAKEYIAAGDIFPGCSFSSLQAQDCRAAVCALPAAETG